MSLPASCIVYPASFPAFHASLLRVLHRKAGLVSVWDYNRGGIDRDMDNDGSRDHDNGGIDRDVDVPF